ncbi:MAG: SHOCT domain-containing protein [Pseudomonadota bacterium]
MSNLTAAGRAAIADLAQRYGLSQDAVEHMARAVANGGGSMAQFNVPELGGSGQWMAGGMTMVGDMFNSGLQNTVSNLCGELSNAMASALFFEQPKTAFASSAWPDWLGQPAATGGQNQARYAYFPHARRLAFDHGDGRPIVLMDTGDHQIGGFSQQQSGPGDPYFGISVSSQFGQFALSSFPLANDAGAPPVPEPTPEPTPEPPKSEAPPPMASPPPVPEAPQDQRATDDILGTIERLAKLRDAGALSEEEFSAKKAELLARL